MSSTTTAPSQNMNTVIHAALRRDLRRFVHGFAEYEAGDEVRAQQLINAWDSFSYQLHRHHQDEETFFWPAFLELGVDPAIIHALEAEHETMVGALGAADDAAATFASHPSVESADSACLAITALEAVLCDHLAHEERDLNPFSVAKAKTKAHKRAEADSRKAHTEGYGTFFSWLSDDIDSDTARVLHSEVPRVALWFMVRLGGRRYRREIGSVWARATASAGPA